jgi:hypothetical protein
MPMTEHSVPRRTVIGGGLGLGAGLATGVVQAQAPAPAPTPATPQIGILTSTGFDDFKAAFQSGFGATTPGYITEEAKGKYDAQGSRNHKELYRGVTHLNKDADIIIAAGGLMAAHAAVQKADKPFLVLVGRIPETDDFVLTDNENYRGGVNLNMVVGNVKRRAALKGILPLGTTDNQIWLLYNPNSRMGKSELNEWTSLGGNAVPGVSGDNDSSKIATQLAAAFKAVHDGGGKGVVISGDPFFTSQRTAVVKAANDAFSPPNNILTCYPFKIYEASMPTPNSFVTLGPDLTTTSTGAYAVLGKKAAVLASSPGAFQGLDDFAV